MPSDLSFICIDNQKTYDTLRTYDETETKKQTNKTRKLTKEKRNPAVFARWNPERGEKGKLEIVKRYSLNDEDQDENLKMAKSACIELSIMKHLREANAFACCAELYGSRLINRENDEELCDYEVKELLENVKKACNRSRKKQQDQEQYWETFEEIAEQVKEIEISMEYGVSLKRFVEQAQKEKVPIVDAQQKIRMLFEALKVLQHLGIMHQDIKPDNVILVQRDAKIVPVFIDFDVSSFFDNEGKPYVYHEGSTPRYQSPEQAGKLKYDNNAVENDEQRVTRATDVYSMAVAACELLDPSFPNSIEEREKVLREFARKDELHGLLAQALSFIPEERPTVENIVRKLMEFCGEIPVLDGVQEIAESSGFFGKLIKWIKNLFKPNGVKVTVIKIRDIIINNSGAVLLGIVGIVVVFALVVVFAMVIIAKQPANPIYVPVPPVTNQPPSTSYQITTTSSETVLTLPLTTTPTTVPSETLQTTTNTSAITAATTSRPVQTTQSSYISSPPPTTPHHTESAVTPSETHPPETTFATTTTPGVGVENDFEYSLVNGQAIVTGYYGTETVVRIPDYLAGSPVSIIDKGAFADKTFISGIQFPCTLIKIEENAFAGCCNLMDVQIPASVTDIGAYAFVNSAGGELSFPNGTQMTVIVENAFYGSLMQKVHIPEGVIEIKESAFRDCSELVDIVLPVSLEYIGNYAFFNSNPIERKLQYCGTSDKWAELVNDKKIYDSATVPSCNYGKNPL
ncbi:MAG: leucine-rich repeat protein [Oscillospiraceae bacterium]|nr:leucine-rich repeat protein [Oscillospiraceae bacterium]